MNFLPPEPLGSSVDLAIGDRASGQWAGDVDGDGWIDLVVLNQNMIGGHDIYVFPGNGDRTFGAPTVYDPLEDVGVFIQGGDVNADGFPDLVMGTIKAEAANRVGVALNDGAGAFVDGHLVVTGPLPNDARVVDITLDGHADIVVTRAATSWVNILAGDSSGDFADSPD